VDAVIILAIVVLSGLLGFWQEHRAAVGRRRAARAGGLCPDLGRARSHSPRVTADGRCIRTPDVGSQVS